MGRAVRSRLRCGCAGPAASHSSGLQGQQGQGPGYALVAGGQGVSWARAPSEEPSSVAGLAFKS